MKSPSRVSAVLDKIRKNPVASESFLGHPLEHTVGDPIAYELPPGIALPEDVEELWREAESVRLFEDKPNGQWGLVLLSPTAAFARTAEWRASRSRDTRPGDLVVGEFLGDDQLVIVRSDRSDRDYGTVLIALPIDRRSEWPDVGDNLGAFLSTFVAEGGEEFWPH